MTLSARAAELAASLGLSPHPEGGFYREFWRSGARVDPGDRRGTRHALTSIYFLLPAGDISRWHRVGSDEVWHHCEGDPLELLLVPPGETRLERIRLGPQAPGQAPAHAVPANWWQAARSLGEYSLMGCTVAPGFEFDDFELLRDFPDVADRLCQGLPEAGPFR